MARVVLITGASRGIGADTARVFAQNGWDVALNYNSSEGRALTLERELAAMGVRAFAVKADVADAVQVRAMVARINARLGEIDALVNNAGVAQQKLFTDLTEDDWNRMFDVNVKGMFHCAQAVARQMIDRHAGSIVNLSSIWGMTGGSCEVHYSAAKAAVIGFTKALAKELGLSRVRVNCVAPGVIDTEMNTALPPGALEALREEAPLGTIGSGLDVARLVYFLAGEQAGFITGQVVSPNGGLYM